MKKKNTFITGFVIIIIAIAFAVPSSAWNSENQIDANMAALSAGVACTCNADCPLGIECINNICIGVNASGRAVCYSQIATVGSSKCLACVTCTWEDGIGSQKGGYCKW